MDPLWPSYGPPIDPVWTPMDPYGLSMDPMDTLWTPYGPPMDPLWTPCGPNGDSEVY